jgi:hypothetical protein
VPRLAGRARTAWRVFRRLLPCPAHCSAHPPTHPLARCCIRLAVPEKDGIRSFCLAREGKEKHAAINCQQWVADWARGNAGVLPANLARLFYLAGPTRDILSVPPSGAASYACGCCNPWAAHRGADVPELAADGSCRYGRDTYSPGDFAWLLPPGSPVDSCLELVRVCVIFCSWLTALPAAAAAAAAAAPHRRPQATQRVLPWQLAAVALGHPVFAACCCLTLPAAA